MKLWNPRREDSNIKRVVVSRVLGGIGDVL